MSKTNKAEIKNTIYKLEQSIKNDYEVIYRLRHNDLDDAKISGDAYDVRRVNEKIESNRDSIKVAEAELEKAKSLLEQFYN